ncbi:MAG: bifunctional hydroxymethylpyrimidine kinase/phosphomethylpyrimidine kinase [Flavobacteriales bacterium]
MSHLPKCMTIAGSDSGGGAGIQADLKSFTVLGTYGSSAITALTAQNTNGVNGIFPVPPSFLKSQIDAVLQDIGTDALKIGMLHSTEVVELVRDAVREHEVFPVVLDPVMVAKSGDRLLEEEAEGSLRNELLPFATLLTPNLPEAELLLGRKFETERREDVARDIAALGPCSVLLKGGHEAGNSSNDLLWNEEKGEATWFKGERIETENSHGTGCTLSAAITAELAKGKELEQAVERAKHFIEGALEHGKKLQVGHGKGPLHHMFEIIGS